MQKLKVGDTVQVTRAPSGLQGRQDGAKRGKVLAIDHERQAAFASKGCGWSSAT